MNPFPASEYIIPLIFLLFAGATIGGALFAVFTKWIIRSVCGLATASVGLAGMFYFLHSPFLAMIQILIYIGAVCITIVFAIMLAEPDEPQDGYGLHSVPWNVGAGIVAVAVFWGVARLGVTGDWPTPAVRVSDGSVEMIGVALLTTQSLALEIVALILLVSILGALAVARKGRHIE
ncbi:MAG: NADH-quinone oxidoreductase subunit J [Opitutales bacterium]|nr:NADH-quinone oxidoreductase subunit J [Opitutales bacterium]